MDTIAHGLTGALVGYCGFRQQGGRAAMWASIVAAEFPDADIVLLASGHEQFLHWHRGPTHSLVLLPAWACLLAICFWGLSGGKNFWLLGAACAAGLASHLFLDWITSYGTMLWWPVSDARLSLNLVFIVDPFVWAILAAGVWAAWRSQRPAVADAALGVLGAYLLVCGFAEARATGPGVSAYPVPLDPLRRTRLWREGDVVVWENGKQRERFEPCRDERLVSQADRTEVVKLFRWFAEFPVVERLEEDGRTVLRYRDLRFRTPTPWGEIREGMFVVAKVTFDERGRLVNARLDREPTR